MHSARPSGAKILVVEDETNVGSTLVERLGKEGFSVTWSKTAADAQMEIQSSKLDLVIMDVGLPDGSGFSLGQQLKKLSPRTALIFLTAYGLAEERVRGLELGAEDYIVKPFHLKELLLRVHNALKRVSFLDSSPQSQQVGRAFVDFSRYVAVVDGNEFPLGHKECALLRLLVDREGAVVSRDEILNNVWSESEYPTPRTVDNFILKLRKLVETNPERPSVIRSVRGVGYQLETVVKK